MVTSYAAKEGCGCHLLAGRTVESIYNEELNDFPLNLTKLSFDKSKGIATASMFKFWKSSVQKTKSRGCVLINNKNEEIIEHNISLSDVSDEIPFDAQLLDCKQLNLAFDLAFDREGEFKKKTRALLVYHKDTLVREQYAKGFDANTLLHGWSINKGIAHALIGILVKNGKLKVSDANLFSDWSEDERKDISIDDLLKMSSGLTWTEDRSDFIDLANLIFNSYDCAQFALERKTDSTPGTFWEYSSGTTNILSKLIRKQFESDEDYLQFPYDSLFTKIGMNSIIYDTDQSGNIMLSTYGYATARDWAKFGLLYLNNGIVEGKNLFPDGWIDYARTPAENSLDKKYGAHFWLNAGGFYPDVPRDMYSCNGYNGQFVYIIPSKDMVVVRLGLTDGEEYDKNGVLKHLVNAVEIEKN